MAVSEAIENYLETILLLSEKKPELHAIDICDELGYSRPTLSVVLKKMRDEGLIEIDKYNHITMTEEGRTIAERVYERHNLLSALLMSFGVSEETALKDACKIEHDISEESIDCIRRYLKENG